MKCRTVALLIAVAALTSCSAESVPPPGTAPAASASAAAKAPAAGAPAPSATAALAGKAPSGTLPVKVRKLRLSRGADRPLPTTVWYPATGKGPYPVIVFSHGLTARPGDYERLLSRWARRGLRRRRPGLPAHLRGSPRI
nr:hypothetical protein GCM10020092_013980 [Actinoplanes digitatis]